MASELWYQLPPDMQTWNTAVIENLARRVPEASQYVSDISWSKIDPSTGDADGLIGMLGGVCSAPITIRGNKLAPVDVVVTKQGNDTKFYPLSPLFLQKIYADNVIGEPVDNLADRDESYEGPARRIQHLKTVNTVKYASIESAKNLLDKIASSAEVANWMAEEMPDTLVAIYNRANDTEEEKTASIFDQSPELLVLTKEASRYFANGEQVSPEEVNTLFKFAGASDDDRSAFMAGEPFVYDMRLKVAAIHIPDEQEITQFDMEEETFTPGSNLAKNANPSEASLVMATVYMRDGSAERGIIITNRGLSSYMDPDPASFKGLPGTPNPKDPSIDRSYTCSNHAEVFIGKNGYAIQECIKSSARTPISVEMLRNLSLQSNPTMGSVGVFLPSKGDEHVIFFGRVENYFNMGAKSICKVYDLVNHMNCEPIDMSRYNFYEVNQTRLPVLREEEQLDPVTMAGVVGRVVRNNEGNYVIDGEALTYRNVPYALMSKYAASYEAAKSITEVAKECGSCVFEAVMDTSRLEKDAAENDNPDKTKNRKGTKSGTDDTKGAEEQPQNPSSMSLATQTPETAMSGQVVNGQAPEPDFFGTSAPQATPQTAMASPVNSKDMENIVHLNSPQVMDAYMMSDLAADNMSSMETINKASDSLVEALSHLSKLLFLIRQGALSYLNETDVQTAMNKVNDVSNALGINPVQVGAM